MTTEIITRDIVLIYSEDESFYYFERRSDWFTSQSFSSRKKALEAYKNKKIKWSY